MFRQIIMPVCEFFLTPSLRTVVLRYIRTLSRKSIFLLDESRLPSSLSFTFIMLRPPPFFLLAVRLLFRILHLSRQNNCAKYVELDILGQEGRSWDCVSVCRRILTAKVDWGSVAKTRTINFDVGPDRPKLPFLPSAAVLSNL